MSKCSKEMEVLNQAWQQKFDGVVKDYQKELLERDLKDKERDAEIKELRENNKKNERIN